MLKCVECGKPMERISSGMSLCVMHYQMKEEMTSEYIQQLLQSGALTCGAQDCNYPAVYMYGGALYCEGHFGQQKQMVLDYMKQWQQQGGMG